MSKNWNPEVYVASFTEEGDLLSQWRGYCPKGGFSLGFSSKRLTELANTHDSFLLPCVYDPKTKNKLVEELLVSYSKQYDNAVKNDNVKDPDKLAHSISNEFIISLFAISPMLKHESFKEEKEWRIVSANLIVAPDIQFRANDSTVIPYIEMGLCNAGSEIDFKKVYIGPASVNYFTKEAVLQLLKKNRLPQNSIHFSSAPYRGA